MVTCWVSSRPVEVCDGASHFIFCEPKSVEVTPRNRVAALAFSGGSGAARKSATYTAHCL